MIAFLVDTRTMYIVLKSIFQNFPATFWHHSAKCY